MGIRSSKSKSVDITTPGSEIPSPTEAKASANGGTDLQEYHDKKLENGDQVAPAVIDGDESHQKSEVAEGEIAAAAAAAVTADITTTTTTTATKVSDSTSQEIGKNDGSTSQEPEPVKENGGVDAKCESDDATVQAVAASTAPIANEEKLDSATDGETVERKDEEQSEDKKKKDKSKEESRKEKKEEEKRRKEEERKRKEEEKKRKEEEKKEKKKDKKRSFSFLQKKKKKEEAVVNGEVEIKDAKEESKEGNVELTEQPLESEVQTKELDESTVSETKQDSSVLESSAANETTVEEVEEPLAEVKAELQQEANVPEVSKEKEPEIEKSQTELVEAQNKAEDVIVEAVPAKVEEPVILVPEAVTETAPKEDPVDETPIAVSPVKQVFESTVQEVEVEAVPQHPAISTVLEEIPPPPPTPPLVSEAPTEAQQSEPESEAQQRLTDPVDESDVPPPLPPTPPPVVQSTPPVPTEPEHEPEMTNEQTTEDSAPAPPPLTSDEVKELSHPVAQVDVAPPSPPPSFPEEPRIEENSVTDKLDVELVQSKTLFPTELVWQHGGKTVAILGSFNNWTDPVELLERDGVFATKLNLNDGEHYLKFQVDGDWTTDKNLPVVNLDGQGDVNVLVVKGEASEE